MFIKNIETIVFLSNLADSTSLEEVMSWFSEDSVDYISWDDDPSCCFVGFCSGMSAHEGINEINFGGYRVKAGFASELRQPNKEASIFLGNLYSNTTVESILDEFSPFGPIMSVNIKFRSDCINAFVEYCNPQSAEEAVPAMRNYYDGHNIVVDFVFGSLKKCFQRDAKGFVKVWTDGCCLNNGYRGARAAIAVAFGVDHPWRVTQSVRGPATNNVAEFEAITKAVQMAKQADLEKLMVFTDSKFVINCMTEWYPYWRRNGWRTSQGGPVINRYQIEELLDAMEGMQLKWQWIPAHSGIPENELVDEMAKDTARSL